MVRKYGPTAKLLDEEQIGFIQLYYKTKGQVWCAKQIGVSHTTLKEMIMRWEAEHGPIEFCDRRPIPQGPRRLFKKEPETKHNSCQRWGGSFYSGTASATRFHAISGHRIA